jgi:hypothetical protein
MLWRRHRAGGSVDAYYREARGAWQKTIKWRLRVVTCLLLALSPLLLLLPRLGVFFCGVWIGSVSASYMAFWEEPPWFIERWRFGREGERWTEKELRKVEQRGWSVRHDLANDGYGNLDHIVIGPGGLFLIDSKHLQGRVVMEDEGLVCRFETSPLSSYPLDRPPEQVGRAAYYLERRLDNTLGWLPRVHGVIALWAEFSEEEVQVGEVAVIHGRSLAEWLLRQPRRWSETAEAAIREAVAALPAAD